LEHRPNWDVSTRRYREYVETAQRRGLTEQQCARLTGRFTEQQIAAAHGGPSQAASNKAQVAKAQRLLINLGHMTGRADGVAGPKTEAAIKSFERAQQLQPTGTLDEKLIVKLREAQQTKLARAKSDKAKSLAQLRDESRKLREETRKGEERIAKLKKQAEHLAARRDNKPKKKPVRPNINAGNFHALVIGINRYRNLPRLRTAVTDARAVADMLKRGYGFRTTLLTNATRGVILDTLLSLRNRLTEKDNLLVYYAGHGVLDNAADRGFWLPRNAREPHFASA
jgi:peptidoglycan hydrolase-like protein with peptidoglycan-binding domain